MSESQEEELICKIANIIDGKKVVVNKGKEDGLHEGQTFIIYRVGEEIIDPDTKQSLGNLEIILGRGTVTHVQDKMATITSSIVKQGSTRVIKNQAKAAWNMLWGGDQIITEPGDIVPFDDPQIGDLAKLI